MLDRFLVFYYSQHDTELNDGNTREDICLYGDYVNIADAVVACREARSYGLDKAYIHDKLENCNMWNLDIIEV